MGKGKRDVERGELTPEEIKSTAQAAVAGGFSTRTTGPGAGRPARNVFAVGFAPDEGRKAESAVVPGTDPAEQVASFNVQNRAVLGSRGANMIQGGWFDSDAELVKQDTSVALPKTTGGLITAMQIGSESNQVAIGNLGPSATNPYIGDINIPEWLHKDQFEGPQGYDPHVTLKAPSTLGGRNRVVITPGRKEMVDVFATDMAKVLGLPEGY